MATAAEFRARAAERTRPATARPSKSASRFDAKALARAAATFDILSDTTRLQVVLMLEGGEMHVGAICEALGMSQPAVSHHLALARHSDIIAPRRQGKNNFYSLTERGQEAVRAARAAMAERS